MALDRQATCSEARCRRGAMVVAAAVAIFSLTLAMTGQAQGPSRTARVGLLFPGITQATARENAAFRVFRDALAQQGYREGQNVVLEVRAAERQVDLGGLAAELVQLKLDVIVAGGVAATRAVKAATQNIPIVGVAVGGDPIAMGLAQSVARPGGNFTGFLHGGADFGKLLQLLKEAFPDVARAGLVWNPDNPIVKGFVERLEADGRVRGLSLRAIQARSIEELDAAFAALSGERIRVAYVVADPLWLSEDKRAAEAALRHRIAAIWGHVPIADAGGLMAYAPDTIDQFRQAAGYVKRILGGTPPGDLPLQYPTQWTLVVNLKTAKAIGVTLSPATLSRADRLIE
jgi:putative tryptophan/tyrosine transport system substrate-binding protein